MLPLTVRRGLRLALGVLAATPSTAVPRPVVACEAMHAAVLDGRLPPGVDRYEFEGEQMLPYLVLWQVHRPAALPVVPDRIAVLAVKGRPLILAFRKEGCVLGLLAVQREEVWTALRKVIGPVA